MSETSRALAPIAVDDQGRLTLPPDLIDLLSWEQAEAAHNTRLHSLRLMETLLLSGQLDVPQMLKVLETLAKYQFRPAAIEQGKRKEKSTEDLLSELVSDE
ncbi:MAG: hypothetical protein J7D61_07775 [Marichromatium sp.]|nr:hypothetical protein [Marichromatium sp.]